MEFQNALQHHELFHHFGDADGFSVCIPADGGRLVRENEILFRRLGAKIPVKALGIVGRPCRNTAAGRQDAHPHNVRKVEQKRKGSDEQGDQQDASPKDGD